MSQNEVVSIGRVACDFPIFFHFVMEVPSLHQDSVELVNIRFVLGEIDACYEFYLFLTLASILSLILLFQLVYHGPHSCLLANGSNLISNILNL